MVERVEKKIEISNTEFISLLIHCSPISSVTIEFILVRFHMNSRICCWDSVTLFFVHSNFFSGGKSKS